MRNRRPSRLRRVAKWVGLGVCVVTLIAWIVSTNWKFYYAGSRFSLILSDGGIAYKWALRGSRTWPATGWSVRPLQNSDWPWHQRYGAELPAIHWAVSPVAKKLGIMIREVDIPFWIPFFGVAIPTAVLWRRDRRPLKGRCLHCGYNLSGNESGVCPECATPVPKETNTA